jgi:hypothetical protein
MSALSKALGDNNLSAAQSAYAQLQSDLPQPPSGSGGSSTSSTGGSQTSGQDEISSLFASLSSALSSNNLSDAQSAFKELDKLFQQQSNGNSATNAYSQNSNALGATSSSSLQVAA